MSSDRDLVKGVLEGDAYWVNMLVQLYYRKVYSLAMKVCSDEFEAKDICQETYLRVFEKLSGFAFRSSLQTWILSIAYNLSVNRLQRIKSTQSFSESILEPTEEEFDLELSDLNEMKLEQLQWALTQLQNEDKLFIELFYLNECSIKEIAIVLNKSETAVKTGLFRARKKLRIFVLDSKMHEKF